jgi:CRISPR-associated endonuclease Csn1
MNENRVLGLDLGVSSIGWAIVDFKKHSIRNGVKLFDAAEVRDTGKSLNLARRTSRGQRRRLRRKRGRLNKLKAILNQMGLRQDTAINTPWELRKKALYEKLTAEELFAVLFHICKCRGFAFNSIESSEDDGKIKKALKANEALFRESGAKTIGEFMVDTYKGKNIRNKSEYNRSIARSHLIEEVESIISKQNQLGYSITDESRNQIIHTIKFQKSTGSVAHMVGNCTYEPSEKRAPKHSYHASLYIAWQELDSLKILASDKAPRALKHKEKLELIEFVHDKAKCTYKQMRKKLNLTKEERFNKGFYNNSSDKDPELKTALELKGYQELKKCFQKQYVTFWDLLSSNKTLMDDIIRVLTVEKGIDELREALISLELSPDLVDVLLQNPPKLSGFCHLSLTAIKSLLPHLESGLNMHDAKEVVGYSTQQVNQGTHELLPIPSKEELAHIINPVVRRAIFQTRKMVNAIIQKSKIDPAYKFDRIHIELARDIKKSYSDREKIKKKQNDNANVNETTKKRLQEYGMAVTGHNILKIKLFDEQKEYCLYSFPSKISVDELKEEKALEIDHILPYSQTYNNSYTNLALVKTKENQDKGNRTAGAYLQTKGKYDTVIKFATDEKFHSTKINNLKKIMLSDEEINGFKERHLNDTRFLSVFIKNYIQNNLKFSNEDSNKQYVFARPGQLTAQVRKLWGFNKSRNDNRHHALDAVIVASTSEWMAQELTNYFSREKKSAKEKVFLKTPWQGFRKDLQASLDNCTCVRVPKKRVRGKLHKEKLKSPKGFTRKKIEDLTLKDIELLVDKESTNQWLYQALKRALEINKKLKKDKGDTYFMLTDLKGHQHRISHIKLQEDVLAEHRQLKSKTGYYENLNIVRTDIYIRDKKYIAVPIYRSAFISGEYPKFSIKAGEGLVGPILESDEFQFSLFPYDVIGFKGKKDSAISFRYYKNIDITNASFEHIGFNDPITTKKEGETIKVAKRITNLMYFKKYQMDPFGKYTEVKNNKFLPIKKMQFGKQKNLTESV